MKRGHVTGGKKEQRQRGTSWYAAIEAADIARVELEWAARQESSQPIVSPTGNTGCPSTPTDTGRNT